MLVVWFQNQGWLPWIFLLAWCAWAVAAGDLAWTQRDGASLAELGVGLLVLAWLWQLARTHRPQTPRWHGWSGGVAKGGQGWHATRLAIGSRSGCSRTYLARRPPQPMDRSNGGTPALDTVGLGGI